MSAIEIPWNKKLLESNVMFFSFLETANCVWKELELETSSIISKCDAKRRRCRVMQVSSSHARRRYGACMPGVEAGLYLHYSPVF
jgi:hypothetical protein